MALQWEKSLSWLRSLARPKKSFLTAWNFTSSSRAVLSARSRKVPMRRKWKASSCSMVPRTTPRGRCEEWANGEEMEGFVLQHGAQNHAARQVRAVLDPFEELPRVALEGAAFEVPVQFQPGLVLRFPYFGGQRSAHGARVLARGAQAR